MQKLIMKPFATNIQLKENEGKRMKIMDEKLFQDLITGLQEMVDHIEGKKELKTTINKSDNHKEEDNHGQEIV